VQTLFSFFDAGSMSAAEIKDTHSLPSGSGSSP